MQPLIVAQQVTQGIADFLRAAFPASSPGFAGVVERFLEQRDNVFKGPYLSIPLPFRQQMGKAPAFAWLPAGFIPHAHQAKAFRRLTGDDARSTLVATGTGSGKTECFLYPILEHCRLQQAAGRRGIKAIILYPMNALAGDQANRVAKEILKAGALAGVRAGLYVGETPEVMSQKVTTLPDGSVTVITDRNELRTNPPDILLTNYKMLDFLLMRAADTPLWAYQQPDTLRYLVVDELHTFDGAQGTDLACLVRRLKGRLDTPPGQLVCVGTSATLGDDGVADLLHFAGDIFGEPMDNEAVIAEDRVSVGDYLADAVIEHMQNPQPTSVAALDPALYSDIASYIAAQYALWFGQAVSAAEVETKPWRNALGVALKSHFAFQNLLRDLDRLGGKSVLLDDLLALLRRRLPAFDDTRYPLLWLSSLLSLIAYARKPAHQDFFLQIKVEIWLRELRRMVAPLSLQPELMFHDDLGPAEKNHVYLPVIHCRDCHATGWGSTVHKTSPNQLSRDLQGFYKAFFAEDVSTRFIFPPRENPDLGVFERKQVCPACGTLHQASHTSCSHCQHEGLLPVEITANLRQSTKNGAKYMRSHHDCPYCGGLKTLSIVGSQAASLAAVMVAQMFSSRFNPDKKLIAFSDSVQDAAHRAGFLAARTWRLNLRPALAQVIVAAAQTGQPLSLADLPQAFEQRWRTQLGDGHYLANFLPPVLHWLRDYEALMAEGELPAGSELPKLMSQIMPWLINAEFGQDARIGRSLVVTGAASVQPDPAALDGAVSWLLPRVSQEIDPLAAATAAEVKVFLSGLIETMIRAGAWQDAGLDFYAKVGSTPWPYKKTPFQYKLLTSPRSPRFLSLVSYKQSLNVAGDKLFRAWAFKAFPVLHGIALGVDTLIVPLYRLAFRALVEAKLAVELDADIADDVSVWGLQPQAFKVLPGVSHWQCTTCHSEVFAAHDDVLAGQPCRRLDCRGELAAAAPLGDYYRKLYLNADIQRVVAHEHTGLLPRETRERVERNFKSDSAQPGAINVLSATPTLEMGIDIGDLSCTLLCSVPPQQANYIQRAGRAGRSTGNALLMTMATSKPHDLYFWQDPKAMIAGSVQAPGVFLNASAVLERQLTAFTLDCWVRETGQTAQIPGEVRAVFAAIEKQNLSRFPYPWLSYIDQNRESLLSRFVALFNTGAFTPLTPETVQWLNTFIDGGVGEEGSLPWKLVHRLRGIAKDVAEIKRQRDRAMKEAEKLQALEVLGAEQQEELDRLKQERIALARLVGAIEGKATLNVLTDEGLLPNYAFPEQGVLLRSIIVRDAKPGAERPDPLTFEYERPGAAAITELAPNNTFYAEGRRVMVNQVDVSKIKPEAWRFCRQCAYTEPLSSGDHHQHCPRCGDTLWRDSGRVHEMLRLTTVFARTLDRDSRIADDSDERQRGFYVRQALVDSAPEAVRQAFVVDQPAFPFGFEFLDKVTFREVNFGEQTPEPNPMVVAGEELNRPGFTICPECGTIQRRRKAEEQYRNHAAWCSRRKDAEANTQQCVFLYREFTSEGIRIFLPEVGFTDTKGALLSFVAALELGLTKRFRGAVAHLRIALDVRMAAGSDQPRAYLVIYDSVPGGTGYLKELMRDPEPLFEVMSLALQSLDACPCNQDDEADGCHRCVYRYHNSSDRRAISRRAAQKLLGQALQHKAALKPVGNLSNVQTNNALLDSVLEQRFIEALRRSHGGTKFELSESLFRGKPGYLVKAAGRRWRLELQVTLGPQDGVVLPSKPDFVFWPDDPSGDKPIAVFMDGWQYHKDIITQDLAKRMAIAKSGKFSVWTLTWDDLEEALQGKLPATPSPWSALVHEQATAALAKLFDVQGIKHLSSFKAMPVFQQLHYRLYACDHQAMRKHACVLGIGQMKPEGDATLLAAMKVGSWWRRLVDLALLPDTTQHKWGMRVLSGNCSMAIGLDAPSLEHILRGGSQPIHEPVIVAQWKDQAGSDVERLQLWQQLWQCLNLLLPLRHIWVGNDAMAGLDNMHDCPVLQTKETDLPAEWECVAEVCDAMLQPFLAAMATRLPLPEDGFALLNDKGRVLAEAELAWPQRKVALLLPDNDEQALIFKQHHWHVCVLSDDFDVEQLIRLMMELDT